MGKKLWAVIQRDPVTIALGSSVRKGIYTGGEIEVAPERAMHIEPGIYRFATKRGAEKFVAACRQIAGDNCVSDPIKQSE